MNFGNNSNEQLGLMMRILMTILAEAEDMQMLEMIVITVVVHRVIRNL